MPTDDQKQCISSAIDNLRSAEQTLDDAIAATGDPAVLEELSQEYGMLDDTINQCNAALVAADDAAFAQATADLKAQAAALKAQEDHIHDIIQDVSIAAKVLGYIAQAAAFLVRL
jgi:predicted  nucleic acid-binding Zn-ribbon protein